MVTGILSQGIKQTECDADHSPPAIAKVRIGGTMLLLLLYVFLDGTGKRSLF